MNRIIDQIVNHFLGQSGYRIRDLEKAILRELLLSSQVQPNTLPTLIQRVSRPFIVDLAADLAESRLAGWIMGMDWVDRMLPKWVKEDFQQRYRPDPVTISIFDWFRGSGGDSLAFTEPIPEPEIRYTIVTNAMQRLAERNILTRDQWDQATEIAKRDSFMITGDFLTSTIGRVRDSLIGDLQGGTSLDSFLDKAGDVLRAGGLSEHRIENIYRTNVQGAFRDGRQTIAQDPVVREAFPYQAYVAIHDARVRHYHQLLDTLGLDGTDVYRADDPFWDYFTPPWDYNCRCGVIMLSLEQAANRGVKEAQRWLETGDAPTVVEHRLSDVLEKVKPNPDFGSRGRQGVLVL